MLCFGDPLRFRENDIEVEPLPLGGREAIGRLFANLRLPRRFANNLLQRKVIEAGRDVEFVSVGDIVSVPFNIACGRCRSCKEGKTGICLNVNPARPGAAYGYVDMGGWVGGQAEYVRVP